VEGLLNRQLFSAGFDLLFAKRGPVLPEKITLYFATVLGHGFTHEPLLTIDFGL